MSGEDSRQACAVGFDIDHTLCIDNKLERVALLQLLVQIVADGGSPRGTLAQESERIDALLALARDNGSTIDEVVRQFVNERGVNSAEHYVAGFRRMALEMVDTFVVPDPHAKPTIDALRRAGVPMGVLSNGWNPLQVAKARRAGFTGAVLASADLGARKPSPAAFAALAERLGMPIDRCFYVGDDPKSDIVGAMSAGMQAVWLDNEGKTYPADLPQPTHVIHGLDELLTLVKDAIPS